MIVVEGQFSGEVVIPLEPNTSRRHVDWTGRGYLVRQFIRMPDGKMVLMPANDVRIETKNLFMTCVNAGYYRFEIYGAKHRGEEHAC